MFFSQFFGTFPHYLEIHGEIIPLQPNAPLSAEKEAKSAIQTEVPFTEKAPGIILIGPFHYPTTDSGGQTAMWLFRHEHEAILLETYYSSRSLERAPWIPLKHYLDVNGLQLKFITATHAHGDHIGSFREAYRFFPDIPIVWHESFFSHAAELQGTHIQHFIDPIELTDTRTLAEKQPSAIIDDTPVYIFRDSPLETSLGGEPLFFIHAPKHSPSDIMCIFRGTMITGDWWMDAKDPNVNHVPTPMIQSSISSLQNFVKQRSYTISRLFSTHANEWHYNVDFIPFIEQIRPRT